MKFKKLDNKKVYDTWKYKNRSTGIEAYIYKMPEDSINPSFFHFQISSAKSNKYCFQYASIDELKLYSSLEDTEKAVNKWWHENIIRII